MGGIRWLFAAALGVAYFLAFCCDNVSSAVSNSALNNPFEHQCTWLFRSNPEDCRTYYQCQHGRSVLRRCPKGLHWNPHGHNCESQSKSVCKASKKKGAPSANTVLEVYDQSKEYQMRGRYREPCSGNGYKPHPTDCSKFIHCVEGNNQYFVQDCPAGLHFDSVTLICNWPSIAQCSSTSTPTQVVTPEPSTTTQSPTTSTLPPFQPTNFPTTSRPTTISWTTSTFPTTRPTTTTMRPVTSTTSPEATTSRPDATSYPILMPQSEKKIVCYYTNWSVYRPGVGRFEPSDIDPSKCTHIIYAFACLNGKNFNLEPCDTWIDTAEGKNHYGQVTKLRELGIIVTIAVGGWNDSGYSKWNQMLKDHVKMGTFITSAAQFIKKYNFDGIDLDYEYPVCPQANCNYDSIFEKQGFVSLIRGLRQTCGPEAIITAAVSCNENIIKEAYDVPTMSKYLNYINLMAYDFHGAWEPKTGINAPYQVLPPDEHHLNAYHAVEVFMALGAPASKLVLGMPTYGQTFTVAEPANDHDIGAKSKGPGPAGQWTKQNGMLAYYEICGNLSAWTHVVKDKDQRVGPYRYNSNDGSWVSYDDEDMIRKKSELIKELGLAGGMVWSLDFDDFKGTCRQGRYPLLSAMNKHLRGPSAVPPTLKNKKKTASSSSSKTSVSGTKRNGSSSSNRISRSNASKSRSSTNSNRRQLKTRSNV